jgi:hypothetical protein
MPIGPPPTPGGFAGSDFVPGFSVDEFLQSKDIKERIRICFY